jgi:hypothetical protein
MSEKTLTIDITPVTNDKAVAAYAEKVETKHPWSDIAAVLRTLDDIATECHRIDDEYLTHDVKFAMLANVIHERHTEASNTFLRFFGSRP